MSRLKNICKIIGIKFAGAILTQNIALAIGIKLVFFALALGGVATIWMAVSADVGASLLVIGNGLQLLESKGRDQTTD